MPDPVLTWSIFAVVWLAYLAREAYKQGHKRGRAALLRDQGAARREEHRLTLYGPEARAARASVAAPVAPPPDPTRAGVEADLLALGFPADLVSTTLSHWAGVADPKLLKERALREMIG